MKCSRCGKQLKDDALFCDNCGTKVIRAEQKPDLEEVVKAGNRAESTANSSNIPQTLSPSMQSSPVMQEESKPKKTLFRNKKTVLIVSIVSAVVVIGFIIALVCVFAFNSQEEPATTAGGEPIRGYTSVKEMEAAGQNKENEEKPESQEQQNEDTDNASNSLVSSKADIINSPTGYILPDSNSRYYSDQELNELTDYELYLARNEIYARYGREFKNEDLQDYFWNKDWYKPQYDPDSFDSHVTLNSYEKKNADTILALEQKRGSLYLD